MSVLSKPYFHDEAAAFEHVEAMLWPEGPVCPHCGSVAKPYKLTGVRSKASKKNPEGVERHGLYKCRDCRAQFTVRIGTIFEESHLPLHIWLQAIHLMCSSKKGISAHQLHRVLECTYKTAWFLEHRIREAMRLPLEDQGALGGNGMAVELDDHSADEYVRGDAYTNTVEGVFSILKRGITGTFHHVSQQHLHRYLAEFDFRYNNRTALGVEDQKRATRALEGVKGKRLTYRRPDGETNLI
ncbi:MAG TPA: transposase [Devosiaceae bacterium]|nr:transposase [Devosiaceae bacterium]